MWWFSQLLSVLRDCEMWVAFVHGAKLRFIPCHLIAAKLGNAGSLHALSGCDTVSAFHGIGKKTAWSVWCSMPHLATVFSRLARAPSQVSPDDLNEIERYVVLLYQRTSALSHVNEARKQLFAQNRKMENIPPTLHAHEQRVKRAVLPVMAQLGTVTHWRARSSIARFMGLEESGR